MDPDDLAATDTDTLEQHAPAPEPQHEPQPVPDGKPARASQPDPRLLDHLLKLANGYRAENALRQAMEAYFALAEAHPDTPQGQQARNWLTAIAEHYEHIGAPRQARSIYERLL